MKYVCLKLFVVTVLALVLAQSAALQAQPLNQWSISCSVDKGAINRRANVWTFRASANKCSGGSWKQRSEIRSEKITSTRRGAYLFQTIVAMKARKRERFDIFQVHDGRDGCAPPLKVTVQKSGRIELVSEVNKSSGKRCIGWQLFSKVSHGRIRRDGTEQKLEVLIDFNGKGGFDVAVWIDGALQTRGRYLQPNTRGAYISDYFYFKHGVYSPREFSFEMTSRGLNVSKVRVNQ